MRNKVTITLFALFIIVVSSSLLAQTSVSVNTNDTIIKHYFNNFNDMHIGYYGTTQNCEAYNVYAFKYRWNWFLIINSGGNLSLMHINPPIKEKKINYLSKHFAEGISRSYAIEYTKLKKRKRDVVDMNIYGYYKFNRYGRKVIKGLVFLEYPFYTKGLIKWKIDEEKAKKKAEKKAAKELKPMEIESIKPEINENVPIKKN